MTVRASDQKVRIAERSITPKSNLVSELQDIANDLKRVGDAHDKHDDTIGSALRGGISSANNKLVLIKLVTVEMPTDAPWVDCALEPPWVNSGGSYPPLQYVIFPSALVMLRGRVEGGVSGTIVSAIDEACTRYDQRFAANSAGLFGNLDVFQSGAIVAVMPGATIDLLGSWVAVSPGGRPSLFPAPHWPVIINHGWEKCLGLVVEGCFEEISGARASYGAPVADWEDIGSGQLRLNGVWGLSWGRRYTLRLRLSAEKE